MSKYKSAIHAEYASSDVRGLIRHQESNCIGDFVRFPQTPPKQLLTFFSQAIFRRVFSFSWGVDPARLDNIYTNFIRGSFDRPYSRHLVDSRFGPVVSG